MNKMIFAAGLIAVLSGGAAVAQEAMAPPGAEGVGLGGFGAGRLARDLPEFSTLDADGDGQITAADFDLAREARFAAIDTNGDGAVDAEEITAAIEAARLERQAVRVAAMIARFDADGDGVLQSTEIPAGGPARAARPERGPEGLIARFDTDGDGALGSEEYAQARDEIAALDRRAGGGDGRPGHGANSGDHRPGDHRPGANGPDGHHGPESARPDGIRPNGTQPDGFGPGFWDLFRG